MLNFIIRSFNYKKWGNEYVKQRTNKINELYKWNNKKSIFIYILLRTIIIICMLREFWVGEIQNAVLCIFSLFLLILPFFIEKKFKIQIPTTIEIIIFLFIFSAEILGEINNFYGLFKNFDTILHTTNGFLCASIGFSFVLMLSQKNILYLSPVFIVLISFCFSMTIVTVWEIFEYSMDNVIGTDMQKDEYVYNIKTVTLDARKDNNVVSIKDIDHSILYDKNNNRLVRLEGYLDIGLHDTMNDLMVNFVGAFVFSVFGYLYTINKDKYKFVGDFITKKVLND